MGKYSLLAIEDHIAQCLNFLRTVTCDVYTKAFWLCSLWSYMAAKKSGLLIVNSNVTADIYDAAVYTYRNSYAHNEAVNKLHEELGILVNCISDDMIVYCEIDDTVQELKEYINKVGEE